MSEWATNDLPAEVSALDEQALASGKKGSALLPVWSQDPTSAILGAQQRDKSDWFYVAILLAVIVHGASLGPAAANQYLAEILGLLRQTRAWQHEYFWTQYDVEVPVKPPPPADKPPEPPPPPEPDPTPAPAPKAEAKAKDDPYDQPPPPSQAAKVLTRKEDPDEPVDLTDKGTVSGTGNALGGQQSGAGIGDTVVKNPAASLTGTPGGTGTGGPKPPPPPPPGPDMSRAATFEGSTSWNCPFPPEADAEQIDNAVVSITVTVRPDGSPLSVSVLNDPGYGFGRAARICALGRRYTPALDRTGQAMTGATPPIRVRFTR